VAAISTVGFVGVGIMGSRMAANLVRAGHDLAVFDAAPGRADGFAKQHGGTAAAALADLGRADLVITMLPTGADVRHVLLEAEGGGLARSLRRGAIVVDMSSSEPTGTRALAGELAALGIPLIDAPVSGGIAGAEKGQLTLMIGTDDPQALEKVRPILAVMGPRQFETGGAGSGHAMKALNNLMSGAGFALMAEVLVVGRKFGLDPAVMIDILNASTGRNHATEAVGRQQVLSGDFATRFLLGLMAKDVKIAADMAEDLRAHAPMTRLARDLWLRAREVVGPAADHTEAVRYWEELNGLRLTDPPTD